ESTPGAGPDQGPEGGRRAQHAAVHEEARGFDREQTAAVGHRQRELPEHGKGTRCRSRPALCEERGGERWTADEAHSASADGTRVPLCAAYLAPADCAGREKSERSIRGNGGRRRREVSRSEGSGQEEGGCQEIGCEQEKGNGKEVGRQWLVVGNPGRSV